VKTFEEWKKAFIDLQGRVDMLVLENNAGIKGWNEERPKSFVRAQTKIPTGCIHDFMAEYCLVWYTKLGEEQGELVRGCGHSNPLWQNLRRISHSGKPEGDTLCESGVAKSMNVTFPLATLKAAKVIKRLGEEYF